MDLFEKFGIETENKDLYKVAFTHASYSIHHDLDYNYERLEFLGDAILKFLSSIQLFNDYPNANRDLLFSLRKEIENNQILFEKSTNKKLEELLFTSPRTIKRMCIPGFTRDENLYLIFLIIGLFLKIVLNIKNS